MMADFAADQAGAIINQTRVITGVTAAAAAGATYLNLHMGGMSQILSGTTPTLFFQPMLCTNITAVATTTGGAPAAAATPVTREQPTPMTMPYTATPAPMSPATPVSSPAPVSSLMSGTHF